MANFLEQHTCLTCEQMRRAEATAMASGTSGEELMERAGRGVANYIISQWPNAKNVAVLCGPGNNGGDGFVVARHLKDAGFDAEVYLLGTMRKLKGDAALMAAKWTGEVMGFQAAMESKADIVIDALFGTGLDRPIDMSIVTTLKKLRKQGARVLAVDLPSGISGDSGQLMPDACPADVTLTFHRKKIGHLLTPSRGHCGKVVVVDIGISPSKEIKDSEFCLENHPDVWRDSFVKIYPEAHKYQRGHAAVVSGPMPLTGASRLAARGALRIGAGLVSIVADEQCIPVHAAHLNAIMLHQIPTNDQDFKSWVEQKKIRAICFGPGAGATSQTKSRVLSLLEGAGDMVLDADALSVFAKDSAPLFKRIRERDFPVVLAPHEGEFSRLFSQIMGRNSLSKLDRAKEAAQISGAVVVYKGADTVIAHPDGRAIINSNAPPTLATAGSGDVLSGFILGLLAQGMESFAAAAAAAWIHGAVAQNFGPGLIAEDLTEGLPNILKKLEKRWKKMS